MKTRVNKQHELNWKKNLLFTIIVILLMLIIIEVGFRSIYAFKIGSRILLYGTGFHKNEINANTSETEIFGITYQSLDTYIKYFPYQPVSAFDCKSGESFAVTINNKGFRGKDIPDLKPPGIIRIVMLGASSTFGFCNRDNETYPHQLGEILNQGNSNSYEVINLGIPHLTSNQIASLFISEALSLNPDIVTFYEGNNDARSLLVEAKKLDSIFPVLHNAIDAIGEYLIIVKTLTSIIERSGKGFPAHVLDKPALAASQNLLKQISMINEECKKRGISFLLATQQRRSLIVESGQLKGVTYKDEATLVEQKLKSLGRINPREFGFLAHNIFMTEIVKWASENDVVLVDVIEALDQDRDTILTQVHISNEGNTMIAHAFAEKILELH